MPEILGAIRHSFMLMMIKGVANHHLRLKPYCQFGKKVRKEGRLYMDKLADYGKKLNSYVLRNEGDVFDLKKLADELNRDFYADVAELKASFCQ